MKFLFINTQFILFCVLVHAQHAEVKLPGTVKNKFESEFVNASAVSWKSLSQSGNYEADGSGGS